MGRPRDHAPEGYVTVREAADLLGISVSAIRQRIKRGTLPTAGDDVTPSLEARHYIPHEAIEQELAERSEVAKRGDVDTSTEIVVRRLEEVGRTSSNNQKRILAAIEDSVAVMRDEAKKHDEARKIEKQMQERVMELTERLTEMMDEEKERRAEREREGLPERRGFWRRILGT